jgi:transcriptional regulator with XRE-family HTH domain
MVGMTQQQLGDRVGIKFQQIQKYETGANRISASRLWDIANALDTPIEFFFAGLEESAEAVSESTGAAEAIGLRSSADFLGDREALDLLRSYYAIPDEQRRRLFDLAQVLSAA